MEHQSIRDACVDILSQAIGLVPQGPDTGDGQRWLCVASAAARLGVAQAVDGQALAILVCADRAPDPCAADDPWDEDWAGGCSVPDWVPAIGDDAATEWQSVSSGSFELQVNARTGEAVAVKRVTRADFLQAHTQAALVAWVRQAIALVA